MSMMCAGVLDCCSLPADVMFLEEPQVARWDVNKQYWRTDGFSNFDFDEGQLMCPVVSLMKVSWCAFDEGQLMYAGVSLMKVS